MDNVLSFAFCVNDGYIHYICVTIKSIIENHRGNQKNIYVLSDEVSERNRRLLAETVADDSFTHLEVIIVDDTSLRGLKDTWSKYAWYRLLLPGCVPHQIQRILYLDADVIVTADITEVFKVNMTDKAVAGCVDPESFNQETFQRCGYDIKKEYICSGVLLMNLDYWREHELTTKIIKWARENNDRIKFPDQDTINVLCQDSKIVLPLRYGIMDFFFENDRFYREPYRQQLCDCINRPMIVHYAGRNPWKRELATTVMQYEWDKYNRMLKHPVKKVYITKGWLLVKLLAWKVLHPNARANCLTRNDIMERLKTTTV